MRRIAITQPFIPRYRVALFEQLLDRLDDRGVDARVFYGGPMLHEANRRGETVDPPWAEEVVTRAVRLPVGWLYFRELPSDWQSGSLLLTELAAGNLNAWHRMAGRQPYALLGQGKAYASTESPLSKKLKAALARRSEHVLTYMKSGEAEVRGRTGLPPNRVSTFFNATDTTALQKAKAAVSADDVASFRRRHGIRHDARCGVYLGALEGYKNIGFLVRAASTAFDLDRDVHLVVAGAGPQDGDLRALAAATGRVTMLGHAPREMLGLLAQIAEVLLIPGPVGLVAVDALAMGLPILTTRSSRHGPEAEYLSEGDNLFVAADDPREYARQWVSGFSRPTTVPWLPGVEYAADRISAALLTVVDSWSRQ